MKDETDRLRHIYHPIEYDPKMTIEEKKPLMVEWWCAAQSLLAASNLNRSLIHEAVEKSPMELRVGARNFIADSLKNQIPVLIFSAGLGRFCSDGEISRGFCSRRILGDVIKSFLEKSLPEFEETPELAHLISNFMIFDDKDNLVAFNKTLIHSFNKSEQILNDPEYRKSIVDRPNVILLGDTIGDVGMIDGIENSTHSLKIGFLNRASIDKLEVYQRAYDIVISDNETFDVPNEILRSVIDR